MHQNSREKRATPRTTSIPIPRIHRHPFEQSRTAYAACVKKYAGQPHTRTFIRASNVPRRALLFSITTRRHRHPVRAVRRHCMRFQDTYRINRHQHEPRSTPCIIFLSPRQTRHGLFHRCNSGEVIFSHLSVHPTPIFALFTFVSTEGKCWNSVSLGYSSLHNRRTT